MVRPFLVMLILALAGLGPPMSKASGPGGDPLAFAYHDSVHAELSLADGSVLRVGHRGPIDAGCGGGTRAAVWRQAANGDVLWARVASPDILVDGVVDELFEGPGAPSSATVVASSAQALDYDPITDRIVVVGDLIQVTNGPIMTVPITPVPGAAGGESPIAESPAVESAVVGSSVMAARVVEAPDVEIPDPEPIPAKARGHGFVLMLSGSGAMIATAPLGQPFEDEPPASGPLSCTALCERLQAAGGTPWRPRAVAFGGSGELLVTGSRILGDGSEPGFLTRLTSALAPLWDVALGTDEAAEGRDVEIGLAAGNGEVIYVAGAIGKPDRDLLIESYDGAGVRLESMRSSGPRHDVGDQVRIEGSAVIVTGRFNAGLDLADQSIDAGECERPFRARFNRQLRLLQIEAVATVIRPSHAAGSTAPELLSIQMLTGGVGGGGLCQLESSDDSYLTLLGDYVNEFQSDVAFLASYAIHPDAPEITQLSLELGSEYCTTVDISLGGGSGSGFLPVASATLCPIGESIGVVPVPAAVSHALGFGGGGSAAADGKPLLLKVELSFFGYTYCPIGMCASGAKDGSVDELDLESDAEP